MAQKSNIADRQLPYAKESELLVIGTLMNERNSYSEVKDLLTVDCFYNDFHKEIFLAIKSIAERGDRPDSMMVLNEMRKANANADAYELTKMSLYSTYDVYQHAAVLFDKCIRRKFFEIGSYVSNSCFNEDEDITEVIERARELLEKTYDIPQNALKSLSDVADDVYKQIDLNLSSCGTLTGSDTGFRELNQISGGFQKSDLIIIAGESSQGKTALMLSLVRNMGLTGSRMAIYSLEMRNVQLAARLISMETHIPSNQILYSKLDSQRIEVIDKNLTRVCKSEIYFDERSTSNIDAIIASIRTMKIKKNIDGAIVDYLQILNVNMKGVNKEQQMADVARRLKNLAKELDIWIIALSQLNRDSQNPVPNLNRLRDSGQIAEAADIVMFVYRPEVYGRNYPEPFSNIDTSGTAMIDIAKGRSIGLLRFICSFKKEITLFSPIENINAISLNNSSSSDQDPF